MHELAICHGLMQEVERVALNSGATLVHRIELRIGALAGVEAPLLQQAFAIARAGSIAAGAELVIEMVPPQVRCSLCGTTSEAAPNRLVCGACGDWRVEVIAGEEMLLQQVELECPADATGQTTAS